tara:strand:- start:10788 stop:11213 length:426 start_codon:yes stop_codon:yes gene_type:complete
MNEHGFVRSVHRKLSSDVFVWKINDKFAGGVPDAFYAGAARYLFIEYKYIKLPKRSSTPIKTGLSAQQKLWLNKMLGMDKQVAVIIGSCSGSLILRQDWDRPIPAELFRQRAMSTEAVAQWITAYCLDKNHDHEEGFFRGC